MESPVEQALAEHHGKVRLTLEGGQRVEFGAVRVARDSVFALTDGDTTAIAPMSDVVEADARVANEWATIALVAGGVVLLGFGIILAICIDEPRKCGAS
jgi:hypothetical protein